MKDNFPFIKQEGIKDCASASILMILKYYKGNINKIKLSEMLKTSKKGTSAFHIVETLKYLGFHAEGIKGDLKDIKILPAIAHVIIDCSYKHYIVIYKIDYKKEVLIIGDPAIGIRKIPFKDFFKIWTGIIIKTYPIKNIVKERKYKTSTFLQTIIFSYKKSFFIIGILSLIITILQVAISFSFQIIEVGKLKNFIITFLLLGIFKTLLDYFKNQRLVKLTNQIDYDLSTFYFKKIINLPYSYYHRRRTGEIIGRINDLKNVKSLITLIINMFFCDFPLMIFSGLILFFLNSNLFFFTLLFLLLNIIITLRFHKKLKNNIDKLKINNFNNMAYMSEAIEGFETIKGMNLEAKIISNFNQKYLNYKNDNFSLNKTYNKEYFFKDIIMIFSTLVIIVIGIEQVKENTLSFGSFMTYLVLFSYFAAPIKNILDLDLELSDSLISLNRIMDITTYEKQKIKNKESSKITFSNTSFSYDDKKMVIKDLNLEIKPNEKIIITGTSGSGKSTMLKLLMNYYEVSNGKIGKPKLKITSISQNERLFTDTLKNNLTLYNDNNLSKIIKICFLEEIISKDDLGLYQLIEENGFNLSGGERQRIALARALMKDFDVLLIDEGLSQMDLSLERKIIKSLFKSFSEKTFIIISHRLDNVDLFDRLIKLKNGDIVFDETKNKGGNTWKD